MLKVILGISAAIGLGVVATEFHEGAGWLSSRIVRSAAKLLPKRLRITREEEWLAELEAFEGLRLLKLFWSLGVYVAAIKLQFRYREERRAERSGDSIREWLNSLNLEYYGVHRPHTAALVGPMAVVIGSLAAAVILSLSGPLTRTADGVWDIWAVWGLVFLAFLVRALAWAQNYIVYNDSEFAFATGVLHLKVQRIALADVQDVYIERSSWSRLYGHGTLIIETRCPCRHVLRYAPYPQQLCDQIAYLAQHTQVS